MLVYDTTATDWVETRGGMTTFSLDVINRMNQVMLNSGIDITFRLAHAMSVLYTTTSSASTPLIDDLYALQEDHGAFAAVHDARDEYGADLVAMLVDHGSAYGFVGVSYVMWSWFGIPSYAFSVNAIRSVDISHTLMHEVGHNLGAHHAKDQSQSPGPNVFFQNPSADYSAGWYFTGDNGSQYHTVMAYNYHNGVFHSSAPTFSTPLLSYQGTAVGDSQDGDNARLLRFTKDVTAGYRDVADIDAYDAGFADVDPQSWAAAYINAIAEVGITTGCGGGNYCPDGLVTHEQMAAFLIRAIEGEPASDYCGGIAPFVDVDPYSWSCAYITRLAELGITTGGDDGDFLPYMAATREQMAVVLIRAIEAEPAADYCAGIAPFNDVDPNSWSCSYIKRLAELGITRGCGGGNYCPGMEVTRAQMAAFLTRAFLPN